MVLPVALLTVFLADVRACVCDHARPETLQTRDCSLCLEADKQTAAVFFVKDANPSKANRTLALPRKHARSLADMTSEERTALWTASIEKAKALWGDAWGLAVNGDERRTQCHMHVHIGKLNEDAENETFIVVDGPADIPVPSDGAGLWVHPVNGKLHVHMGEQVTEFVLKR